MVNNNNVKRVKLNQEIAIERMRCVHQNIYDYSKFVYINIRTKGEIICKEHGSFFQTYGNHVFKKSKCPKCAYKRNNVKRRNNVKKLSLNDALIRMRNIHGEKFNYDMFDFSDTKTPGKIQCPNHGYFWMSVIDHIKSKTGCPTCSKEIQRKNLQLSFNEIIVRAKHVHGDVYEYPKQIYKNTSTPIEIICKEHGVFKQSFNSHVHQMSGCPTCFGLHKKTNLEFIKEARSIHGDVYDYSCVEYSNSYTSVKILCVKHGTFWQKPNKHINSQKGCPRCADSTSKLEIKWLNRICVPQNINNRHIQLENTNLIVNGKIDNQIFEYYGSYWHGDPRKYNQDNLNFKNGRRMGTLYLETLERQDKIKKLGYELKFVWEIDFRAGLLFSELNPHEI